MFSIIIPNYNSEKWIKKLLESILYQTYKDFEVIIIDDVSNDNSVQIISQLAEKYNLPKYIVYNRYKAKWDIEDIVNRPIDISKMSKKYGK